MVTCTDSFWEDIGGLMATMMCLIIIVAVVDGLVSYFRKEKKQ
jgi:hypothetical protein